MTAFEKIVNASTEAQCFIPTATLMGAAHAYDTALSVGYRDSAMDWLRVGKEISPERFRFWVKTIREMKVK